MITLNGTVNTSGFYNSQYKAILIDFDHNMNLETGGKHNITLHFGQDENGVNICFRDFYHDGDSSASETGFRMNYDNYNGGGWEFSQMRNDICPQFLEVLPNDLQNIIGTTTKYTDNVGNATGNVESNVTATQDKIFLLSYHEVGGTGTTHPNRYEADYTEPYSEMYSSNSNRIKYKHFDVNSESSWWLRSPQRSIPTNYCRVSTDGDPDSNTFAYNSGGFAPAFTIY